MKMTDERWQRINSWLQTGDPLKDINCDEEELICYIEQLREELNKEDNQA